MMSRDDTEAMPYGHDAVGTEIQRLEEVNAELLVGLRQLVRVWDRTVYAVTDEIEKALQDADKAIAKAEGR